MPNEIGRINRKIKAAMTRFIKHEDESSFKSIFKLAKEREELLKARPFVPKDQENDER